MPNWLTDLFEDRTVPGGIIQHRKRYGLYVKDTQEQGKEFLPFEAWLAAQGIDPASLGLEQHMQQHPVKRDLGY